MVKLFWDGSLPLAVNVVRLYIMLGFPLILIAALYLLSAFRISHSDNEQWAHVMDMMQDFTFVAVDDSKGSSLLVQEGANPDAPKYAQLTSKNLSFGFLVLLIASYAVQNEEIAENDFLVDIYSSYTWYTARLRRAFIFGVLGICVVITGMFVLNFCLL